MPSKYHREAIVERLLEETRNGRSILAVGVGNGLSARCADQAGADLLVVYNSGYYRMNGLPSFAASLPINDANAMMLRLGRESIQPWARHAPVIGGVFAIDPTRHIPDVLDEMQGIGYSGVINFPYVDRYEGALRKELEAAGLGLAREIAMVAEARRRGMFSMTYVKTAHAAAEMARAGADVIVGHMGLTEGGDIGAAHASGMERALIDIEELFDAALAARGDVILLSHGGPITDPATVARVNAATKAVGFVAASSFERIPVETALKTICHDFKSAGGINPSV